MFVRGLAKIRSNTTALGFAYILVAALLLSLMPLTIDLSGSGDRPLTVGAGVLFGFVAFTLLLRPYLPAAKYADLAPRRLLERCRSQHVGLGHILAPITITGLGGFSYVAFSWSTVYIDTAASSSIYELWPLVWFLSMQFIDRRRHGPYAPKHTPWTTYILMLFGLVGITLVIYSTRDNSTITTGTSLPVWGVALALIAPILGACATSNFLFIDRAIYGRTTHTEDDWKSDAFEKLKIHEIEEHISLLGVVTSRAVFLPIVLALAIASHQLSGC